MSSNKNDEIRPKLGKPKLGGDASSRRLVSQLLARGVTVRRVSPAPRANSRRNVADFHRGKAAMKLKVRAPGPRSRREMVQTRIVNSKGAGPWSIATHLRYIERDGVTPDGTPASAYGAELEAVDTQEFASRCQGDRHQFRFIVSPEDGVEIDLKAFTRELMTHMERDLVVAVAVILDGTVTLLAGWTLHRRYRWSPWLVVCTTASLIPFEVLMLARHPSTGRVLLLLVNALILAYLIQRRHTFE